MDLCFQSAASLSEFGMDRNNPVPAVLSAMYEDAASFNVNIPDTRESELRHPHSARVENTEKDRHDHSAVRTFGGD